MLKKSTQSATYKTITYLKFVSSEVQMEKKKKYRKLIKKILDFCQPWWQTNANGSDPFNIILFKTILQRVKKL